MNTNTGEIYAEAGEELTEPQARRDRGSRHRQVADAGDRPVDRAVDPQHARGGQDSNRDEALIDIYRVMRPGEPPTPETAEALFRGLFFDPDRYDLSAVGRVKMNMRLGFTLRKPRTRCATLRKEDILARSRPVRAEGRPRPDRRHRQSRQSPGALGRRADGEPVPRRPAAHGARDPGAHGLGRHRHGDAARPDQRQAGGGGGAGVLRLLAAVAVHGPDQSAVAR